MGVRRLSEICFTLGVFLMISLFCLDETEYLCNLTVQSMGFYVQNLAGLGTHTDTFEQLGLSHSDNNPGPPHWMKSWTMFYWGWWIAWSPFVGMFIAKISRGRTIREFLNGTLTAPLIFAFCWIVIFGGTAIRKEREAATLGLCCKDSQGWFIEHQLIAEDVAKANLTEQVIPEDGLEWMCDGECGSCASSVLNIAQEGGLTFSQILDEYGELREKFGSISADRVHNRLSCHSTDDMWFEVMMSYGDVGAFLSYISLVGIALYFITSSDSGMTKINRLICLLWRKQV